MRRTSYFAAAAVLVGLVTSTAMASDLYPLRSTGDRVSIHTVAHPGMHGHPGGHGRHDLSRHARPGYYHYGRPPMAYPPYPRMKYAPVIVPPVYPGYPHRCGPHCGPRCGYGYPPNSLYYRGSGWGFSFSF